MTHYNAIMHIRMRAVQVRRDAPGAESERRLTEIIEICDALLDDGK